jgi:transglutaminase-like putative cysteine protease
MIGIQPICRWIAFALLGFVPHAYADEISREAPPLYREQLAELLTPLDQVLKADLKDLETKAAGCTRLEEHIYSVDTGGRRMMVRQIVRKTLTEAGARWNAEETFTFRKKEQKFYLLRAETIDADGTVQPVKENAVLVQSPQRQAQYALYDDQAEVRIIFPNVKPGSFTHVIVVTEDLKARMPGEFTETIAWSSSWPIGKVRYLIDLPEQLAARLQINTVGNGVPVPGRQNRPGKRLRLTFLKEKIPPMRDDVQPAPATQIGPCVHLSTVADWNAVGRWFAGLLKGRDQLTAELATQVDALTQNEKTPDDILRVLLAKVANDVRYTGLELGEADYQPHECNEVWKNKYGDCKDKANLLAAFLRHKGIPAQVALLNTEHAGLIDRRSPDYRVFTHAIVALPDGKGGYRFCDPTIDRAQLGILSPTDTDRDVFVVGQDAGVWTRTPAQSSGRLAYNFELNLRNTGELAGWLTLTGEGYFGAGQEAWFEKLDSNEARQQMGQVLQGFYPGAELIEVSKAADRAPQTPYAIKTYFVVPRHLENGAGNQTLLFPQTTSLLPSLGYTPERDTPYFLYLGRVEVTCSITVPPGLVASELPIPYNIEMPAGHARAQWRMEGAVCRAEMNLDFSRSLLGPEEFKTYYGAIQSLKTWLEKPIVLSRNGTATAASSNVVLDDFPLMPTGTGQLALLNNRYPPGSDPALRRAALEKILQYFPSDKPTTFQAGVYLSGLDWDTGKKAEAMARLQMLLATYKAELKPDIYGWGEFVEGSFLREQQQLGPAQEVYVGIAKTSGVSEELRAQSALRGADILRKTAPDEALALLNEAAAWTSTYQGEIHGLIAYVLLQQDKTEALRQHLADLIQRQPAAVEELFCRMLKKSEEWAAAGDDVQRQTLCTMVEQLVAHPGQALTNALAAARASGSRDQILGKIQFQLRAGIASEQLADWYAPMKKETLVSSEDFDQAIQIADSKGEADRCLLLSIHAALTTAPTVNLSRRLWQAAAYVDWKERNAGRAMDTPLQQLVFDCCDQLPKDDGVYWGGRLYRAAHLSRKGDYPGEQAMLNALLTDPQLLGRFKPAIYGQLGGSLEKSGDFDHALEAYAELEKSPSAIPENATRLLHAVFINLHLNRPAQALHLIGVLETFDAVTLGKAEGGAQIRELIALGRSGKAEEFWSRRNRWWVLWKDWARKVGLAQRDWEAVVPVISNERDWGIALGEAVRVNNRAYFFLELSKGFSAARWLPGMSGNLAGLSSLLPRIAPEALFEYRKLMIVVLEQSQEALGLPEGLRNRRLLLATNYIDDGTPGAALEVFAALRQEPQPDDATTLTTHRLWGMAALAAVQEREESAAALEKDLEGTSVVEQRALFVVTLADLYRALNRREDEKRLLNRELGHPQIMRAPNERAALGARLGKLNAQTPAVGPMMDLSNLSTPFQPATIQSVVVPQFSVQTSDGTTNVSPPQNTNQSANFSDGVARWLKHAKPGWYDFAEPSSLADPRLRNLAEVLKTPAQLFITPEVVKLQLLVAQDPGQPLATRQTAWFNAVQGMLRMTTRQTAARALIDSLVQDASFDENLRTRLLSLGVSDAFVQDRKEDFERWMKHPLAKKFNDAQKDALTYYTRWLDVDKTSSAALVALARSLSKDELKTYHVLVFGKVIDALAQLGDIEGMRTVAGQLAAAKLAPGSNVSLEALQMSVTQQLRTLEALQPIHEALARKVRESFPDAPSDLPAEYADLRKSAGIPFFAPEVTLRDCLYLIKVRQFNRSNLQFWTFFKRATELMPDKQDLMLELLRLALTEAKDDSVRSDVAELAPYFVDIDDADVRQKLKVLFAPYRQAFQAPLTYAQIRMNEIAIALRTGQPVDIEGGFEGLNHPRARGNRVAVSLRHWVQTGNSAALKQMIEGMNPQELLGPRFLVDSVRAFATAGMSTEANLAREAARRELKQTLLATWATGSDLFSVGRALDLAEMLENADDLPRGWVLEMSGEIGDPTLRHRLLRTDAWLNKRWDEVVKQADELIRLHPDYYAFYWHKGMALCRLGREAEAIAPLSKYVEYCKDEVAYPETVALLKRIKEAPVAK